jgi:hypothetical protein
MSTERSFIPPYRAAKKQMAVVSREPTGNSIFYELFTIFGLPLRRANKSLGTSNFIWLSGTILE